MRGAHATVETLSSYLDRELESTELVAVEGHLADCAECRGRLDGLGRVAAGLERLEAQAPPAYLGADLERRLSDLGRRRTLRRRFEDRMRRMPSQSVLLPAFATVVALAVILVLWAYYGGARDTGGTRVLFDPAAAEWVRGLEPPAEDAAERTVGGRTFGRLDGAWVETGCEAVEPSRRYPAERLPPALEPFAELEPPVRLRLDGEVVEIVPRTPPEPGSGPPGG